MPRFFRAQKRFDWGKWLMLALLFALSYALFYQMTLRPSSDIAIHATWAAEGDFRDPTSFVHHGAHPMWHVLVSVLLHLGLPLPAASALITALSKVFIAYATHCMLASALRDRLSETAITLFTGILMLVACLCVPALNPTVYAGIGTPNTWHSCTQLMAMAFMLVCVPRTARCYELFCPNAPLAWRQPVTLGILLFLSLLAKPTFMQAFLPAASLFFLYQWIRRPQCSRCFVQVLVCVLPAVALMIFQYLYYFGIIVPWQSSVVLEYDWGKALHVLLRVVLIMAFPLYTLVLCRAQKADTTFVLTLLLNLTAIVEMLLLGEDGRRASDGNFGWGMMGASLMLWVVCLIRFLRQQDVWNWRRPRNLVGWLLLAWHLVSGVYYVGYLFVSGASL